MLWEPKHDFLMAAAARYYDFCPVQPPDFSIRDTRVAPTKKLLSSETYVPTLGSTI
jgi:hypothetical protein